LSHPLEEKAQFMPARSILLAKLATDYLADVTDACHAKRLYRTRALFAVRPGFQRIASRSGKADSDGAHPLFRLPIRWKKKRNLCPSAVYIRYKIRCPSVLRRLNVC
jgi:hypothetical protein